MGVLAQMKLAIMQPYFFPYLGYFDLIHSVDLFIIYDTVQYIRRGWINRNRILHQSGTGWQYVTVPVEHAPQTTPIMDTRLAPDGAWRERIGGQLGHYRSAASRAGEAINFVLGSLSTGETTIARLNTCLLERCCELLQIPFRHEYCSALDIRLDPQRSAQERILDLCEFVGANEYVNLPGGVTLYDPEHFEQRGIRLTFRELPSFTYDTPGYAFEPNLSIIDTLMWKKPEDIRQYLDENRDAQHTGG